MEGIRDFELRSMGEYTVAYFSKKWNGNPAIDVDSMSSSIKDSRSSFTGEYNAYNSVVFLLLNQCVSPCRMRHHEHYSANHHTAGDIADDPADTHTQNICRLR